MELLLIKDVRDWLLKTDGFIYYPEFIGNNYLNEWVSTCGKIDSREMCRVLNSINNQGIESVNLEVGRYTIKGVSLALNCLSTGERMFFCAELARQTQTHVYLYKGLSQLTPVVQGIYYREFVDCEYVHLVFDHHGQLSMFKKRGGRYDESFNRY